MNASSNATPRRNGVTAIHSLNRFVFTVPKVEDAQRFYSEFGLDVHKGDGRVDLYSFGHPHCWGSIVEESGRKTLQYLSFGVYEQDYEALIDSPTEAAPGCATRTVTSSRSSSDPRFRRTRRRCERRCRLIPKGVARRRRDRLRDGYIRGGSRTCSFSAPTYRARSGSIPRRSGSAYPTNRAS